MLHTNGWLQNANVYFVDGVQYIITLKGGKVLDTPQSTKITMECDANGDKNVRGNSLSWCERAILK